MRLSFAAAWLLVSSSSAFAQLDSCIDAHGGLAKWRGYRSVEFDQSWTSAKGTKQDHQLFDLQSRSGLITSASYTLGSSQGEVWIKPDAKALGGTPPRFYMWTPFYFFAMPFVFADEGAIREPLGKKAYEGIEYDAVKVTYKKDTGDSPDDFYIVYVDPKSQEMKLASYVVTFPALRKGRPIDQLEAHAIVFASWQEVGGLKVPKLAKFFTWKNEKTEGEPLGTLEFSNVKFSEAGADAARFAKPADAVVAPLQ